MGISDKNGLMVNSEKVWFPFRGTSQHLTQSSGQAAHHSSAGCRVSASKSHGPSVLHTTEAEGVLQGTLHPSSCHPGEHDEQAMLFHIP